MALFPGLPGWASTRKVKPVWILLKQETVSGSGISWVICKSAPCCRQITTPATHHLGFLQVGCSSCRPTNSVKALKGKHHDKERIIKVLNDRDLFHIFGLYLGFTFSPCFTLWTTFFVFLSIIFSLAAENGLFPLSLYGIVSALGVLNDYALYKSTHSLTAGFIVINSTVTTTTTTTTV